MCMSADEITEGNCSHAKLLSLCLSYTHFTSFLSYMFLIFYTFTTKEIQFFNTFQFQVVHSVASAGGGFSVIEI